MLTNDTWCHHLNTSQSPWENLNQPLWVHMVFKIVFKQWSTIDTIQCTNAIFSKLENFFIILFGTDEVYFMFLQMSSSSFWEQSQLCCSNSFKNMLQSLSVFERFKTKDVIMTKFFNSVFIQIQACRFQSITEHCKHIQSHDRTSA